jgi:hypothetical protein
MENRTFNPAGDPTVILPDFVDEEQMSTPEDFDRFADFTRKLVNVPKKEIDEERQRE